MATGVRSNNGIEEFNYHYMVKKSSAEEAGLDAWLKDRLGGTIISHIFDEYLKVKMASDGEYFEVSLLFHAMSDRVKSEFEKTILENERMREDVLAIYLKGYYNGKASVEEVDNNNNGKE